MSILRRPTARLAVVASFAALLAAACSPDSKDLTGLSGPTLSASRNGGGNAAVSGFTVLANAAVTCTRDSIIGDVGTFQTAPPGAVTLTEGCFVTGAVDIGGPAAVAAYEAFLDQYAALAPRAGDICTTLSGTLAGMTLSPGVYCFPAAAALTGTLTLNGPSNGTWIFKIGSAIATPPALPTGALTGTNFSVVMAGNAQACNVTWWVAQAVTMTTSAFQGNILAGAAISMTDGTLNGNAWAGAAGVGDVTFTGTAVTGCESRGNGHPHKPHKPHKPHDKCNQGVGNGREGCDPGNSNHRHSSNDEDGGTPGHPGRQGGDHDSDDERGDRNGRGNH